MYVKQIAVLELLFVASGFGLRAAFGGAATDTELTVVFLFVISCFSIFLAGCKSFLSLFPTILIHDAMCLIGTPTCFFVMR